MKKILIGLCVAVAIIALIAVVLVNRWANTPYGKLDYKVAVILKMFEATSGGLLATLTEKLGKGALFDAMYRGAGHDIAVALDSIQGVPEPREPAPARYEVACHHLNYFASDAGLAALASIDW